MTLNRRSLFAVALAAPFTPELPVISKAPSGINPGTWAIVLKMLDRPDGPVCVARSFKTPFQRYISVLGSFDEWDPVEFANERRRILEGQCGSTVVAQAEAVLGEVTRRGQHMPVEFHEQLDLLRGLVRKVHGI